MYENTSISIMEVTKQFYVTSYGNFGSKWVLIEFSGALVAGSGLGLGYGISTKYCSNWIA
jgi:hypothetical protein